MWPSVVFIDIRLKMRTGMWKKYDKKLPSEWLLKRKHFRFFHRTSSKQKCRYDI